MLIGLSNRTSNNSNFFGFDLSQYKTPFEKAINIKTGVVNIISQKEQLNNPDSEDYFE